MYCISDAEYIRDFTMMLNDDIIDCFTEKTEFSSEEKAEILGTLVEEEEIKSASDFSIF